MQTSKVYECQICKHINHVSRYACSACGTIPARYSITGSPAVIRPALSGHEISPSNDAFITVHVAFGAERIGFSHATKVKLRTVPGDYYAEV